MAGTLACAAVVIVAVVVTVAASVCGRGLVLRMPPMVGGCAGG
jgi:hypothetical protein